MYANTQYRPAAQQWTALDPNFSQHFASNRLTETRGGSQVLETQQPTKPGIGGKISNIAHRVGERFSGNANSRWAAFGLQEPLLQEYAAKTAFGNTRIGGWIFLSQGHFGWISHTDAQNRVIKTLIPWSNVMDIVPTARVRGQSTKTYQFSPIMAPGTTAEGFQIFTKDNLIYQFFGLKKNIDLVFNFFNQLWVPSYGTRPGFTSGLHHGGFSRGLNHSGLAQTGYGQPTLATGLAQPSVYNAGLTQPGLVGGHAYPATTGLGGHPGLSGTTTTTYVQPATYGQTGFMGQTGIAQPGLVQTGLAGTTTYAQPAVYGQGLAGQAYGTNTLLAKEGYVQPQTGMALGQTAPTNFRNL